MKNLLIIGAGNVGGFLAYNIDLFQEKYSVLGFLDDDVHKIGKILYGQKVLGNVDSVLQYPTDTAVAIGIASPKSKVFIYNKIKEKGFSFPSFVSSRTWLSNKVKVGQGTILYPGVSINYETEVQDFVIMNMNCAIGHNCHIANFSSLAPGVNLAGFSKIEQGADVGIGVSTKQNIVIGENAVIGGQSMLVKNVCANTTIVGVPGRTI
jgi:sugar O-acyltransferase (sialic acid O-acetyltransferase NeuD family)